LRGIAGPGMRATPPHRRIHAFDIERTLDELAQNLVRSKIWRKSPQVIEEGIRVFVLDVVPVFRAFLQSVRQISFNFHRVVTGGRAGGVGNAGTHNLKSWWFVE